MKAERPTGVTAVAIVFLAAASYLFIVGLLMLFRPGLISMAAGAQLLGGFETAGPYMFLLIALLGAVIALGLLQLNNWARRAAVIVTVTGIVLLVPTVSAAVAGARIEKLIWSGLGMIVRVLIAFYLYRRPVIEVFETP